MNSITQPDGFVIQDNAGNLDLSGIYQITDVFTLFEVIGRRFPQHNVYRGGKHVRAISNETKEQTLATIVEAGS